MRGTVSIMSPNLCKKRVEEIIIKTNHKEQIYEDSIIVVISSQRWISPQHNISQHITPNWNNGQEEFKAVSGRQE